MRRLARMTAAGMALCTALLAVAGHAGELADPTRPPQSRSAPPQKAAPAEPLSLDFVVRSRGRHLARINGAWVREGETVAGARVERIEADRVLVRRAGRTLVLRLGGEDIQKKTTER